ncbi:disulfide bond formation protein B [Stappia sp. F7233]|uniref:Disulfide bond formation protein B n=2 Tax=Stappia albiluteola TaxID=2758565 RepID=A0A839AFP8_9HYPH|nr:disulfide bond formation protein B [Stappia albiluteola]MBA5778471.1 disulfide bond formation protein B [Stappia albiluteola]
MPAGKTLSKLSLSLLLLLGLATISAAWGFQLIGGYVPCKLCLEQRVPYYVGLPLAALALVLALADRVPALVGLLLAAVAVAFAYGSGLGIYQAGAEWGFWPGPSDCGGGTAAPTSAENLLSALSTTRVVSCTEASWRLFGLSFAGWNAVASAALAALALVALVARRRKQA